MASKRRCPHLRIPPLPTSSIESIWRTTRRRYSSKRWKPSSPRQKPKVSDARVHSLSLSHRLPSHTGLKVKISLPDDGLVIENTTDLSRSWIFRTSDLLYFWRDSLFLNVIVVVTINRSRHRSTRPYSASIFRLRGTESAQSFLQQAQHYFDKLSASASTLTPTNTTAPVEKPTRPKSRPTDYNQSLNGRSKTKRRTTINEPFSSSILDRPHSSQTTAPIRLITRAEFDPGNMPAKPIANGHHRRTYSETASSNDSNSAESAKEILSFTRKLSYEDEDEEDDKMTTVSNNLSADYVADLLRELKDLRNEIAELKLEKRITPEKRSMSTSPLAIQSETHKQTRDSSNTTSSSSSFHDGTSQSEVDAETQTDFSLIAHRRRQSSRQNKRAMNGSSSISKAATRPAPPSAVEPARRPYQPTSTSTSSDHEGNRCVLLLPSVIDLRACCLPSVEHEPIRSRLESHL